MTHGSTRPSLIARWSFLTADYLDYLWLKVSRKLRLRKPILCHCEMCSRARTKQGGAQ